MKDKRTSSQSLHEGIQLSKVWWLRPGRRYLHEDTVVQSSMTFEQALEWYQGWVWEKMGAKGKC